MIFRKHYYRNSALTWKDRSCQTRLYWLKTQQFHCCGSHIPVKVLCIAHKPVWDITCCCSVITAKIIFLMHVSSGMAETLLTSGWEQPCHQAWYNLLWQFPWVANWAFFHVSHGCSWAPASQWGGKIRFYWATSCLLLSLQEFYFYFCWAELLNTTRSSFVVLSI